MNKKTKKQIVMGLCVGHDALAHNPVGAIYCPYVQRRLNEGLFSV